MLLVIPMDKNIVKHVTCIQLQIHFDVFVVIKYYDKVRDITKKWL